VTRDHPDAADHAGMTVGAGLFLIAVGAILYFAVTAEIVGIDVQTVGLILMIVGAIGLALGLMMAMRRPGPGPPPDDRL
jgi:hypothetical protein